MPCRIRSRGRAGEQKIGSVMRCAFFATQMSVATVAKRLVHQAGARKEKIVFGPRAGMKSSELSLGREGSNG